jgi:hypothetical protein
MVHDARPRIDRQTCILLVRHDRKQFLHPLVSLRSHDAELGQMCAQCIDHLSTLAHHRVARAMLHQLPCCSAVLICKSASSDAEPRDPDNFGDTLGVNAAQT